MYVYYCPAAFWPKSREGNLTGLMGFVLLQCLLGLWLFMQPDAAVVLVGLAPRLHLC